MNRNYQILFNVLLFVLAGLSSYGQEKTKTYKETFNVGKDAVLNIDTSHADIEFETWNKDQVEVTAVVKLQGATEEEAKAFFEKDAIKIVGNSKEIEVSTIGSGFKWDYVYDFNDLNIVIPELPEMPEIPELPEIMVIPELPPMPPMPFLDFDYDAYKKDGDKYLKKWKKEFDQNFDEEYQDDLREWSEQMKEMAQERKELQKVEVKKLKEERKKIQEEHKKVLEEARVQRDELKKHREEVRREVRTRVHSGDNFNFYFSSDVEGKKYKVKKRIKIKMPKSVKLKMNVRHGEVKLAANTKNINASLSYASLLASTIGGNNTNITASYSPVVVQKWNYGQLKTDYSETVDLKEVKDLKLNSVSSNVIIGELMDKVFVTNNLGALHINSVADGFTTIDISVKNGEVDFKLPSVPFTIHVNETTSDFEYPSTLTMDSSKRNNTNTYKGYYINNKDGKSINIDSKYSEVVLKE